MEAASQIEALRLLYERLHTAWCPDHKNARTCGWLTYALFQTDPEVDDLMLGFPLGLS